MCLVYARQKNAVTELRKADSLFFVYFYLLLCRRELHQPHEQHHEEYPEVSAEL